MHPKFLDILCCPETGDALCLHAETIRPNGIVVSGALSTPAGRSYPIMRGVPRFVGAERYASSFGYEWGRWPRVQFESENAGRPMAGHTTRMWERITGVDDRQVDGKRIVEFGCGPGRFLDVVRRKGGTAVGIDLSGAVDAARKNFADDPDVLIVQGDLLNPPFRPGVFDGGFTIGVLHHTPDPAAGLAALARTLRPGGWAACCVYPRGDFYDFASVRRWREIHRRMKVAYGYRFALAYSYFAAYVLAPLLIGARRVGLRSAADYIERNWLVALRLKDPRWRVLDVFDAITPEIATTHTREEVAEWMRAAGLGGVRPTRWCETSAAGRADKFAALRAAA
jgi:SAM-dependent methyltransferase